MGHRTGLSAYRSAVGLLGVVLLILALAASGGVAASSPREPLPFEASACETVVAQIPETNSSVFQSVCSEPSFASALQMWGLDNFTYGSTGAGSYVTLYWGFVWAAPCTDVGWNVSTCSYQETWSANSTTGAVTGPVLQQYPWNGCACVVVLSPSSASLAPFPILPVIVLLSGALVGGALALGRLRIPR